MTDPLSRLGDLTPSELMAFVRGLRAAGATEPKAPSPEDVAKIVGKRELLAGSAFEIRDPAPVVGGLAHENGAWIATVEPLIARFEVAAKFGASAVHNDVGSDAIAKLMRSMAEKLDYAAANYVPRPPAAQDEVEAVARIIDPAAWKRREEFQAHIRGENMPDDPEKAEMVLRSSLRRVDTIVAPSIALATAAITALRQHEKSSGQ